MILSKKTWNTLTYSWGILLTLAGKAVGGVLQLAGYKPKKNIYGTYYEVGDNWGGFNLGPVSIVNRNPSRHTLEHEFGHSVQNCILGPFMIFAVAIPSAVRYWYREYQVLKKGKRYSDLPDYDSIWFEGTATSLGEEHAKYYKKISNQ